MQSAKGNGGPGVNRGSCTASQKPLPGTLKMLHFIKCNFKFQKAKLNLLVFNILLLSSVLLVGCF